MSDEVSISCTYCQNPIVTFVSDVDRLVKCKQCGRFNKLAAQPQKRIEMECPECHTEWNISIKMRGTMYKCWNCNSQTKILEPAQLNVDGTHFPNQVEQGGQNYEVEIILVNMGTPTQIEEIRLTFLQNDQDVT